MTRPAAQQAALPTARPFVRLAGAGAGIDDQVMREQAEMFDPTPLFFPTKWNFGQSVEAENVRPQPGQVFGSFGPMFTFTEREMKSYGAEATAAPEKIADVLIQGSEAPFDGLGQVDAALPPLPERDALIEVRGFTGGKRVLSETLVGVAPPRLDFAPVEFLVAVNRLGIIGQPVLSNGSGWDEVDGFFREYLVKNFRVGERLSPGRYWIVIGR
jgi:hypothetical protein